MAIDNLFRNAVEALRAIDRGRLLEFSMTSHLGRIHLIILDNGPGLPEERRRDPFAPGLSQKRTGMGLGLAIARDCIEAMGGTIGVRTSDAEGTCFEITLTAAPP